MSRNRDLGEFPAAALDIDAAGNVGIGTTVVDSLLHLQKTDATAYSSTATDGQVGVGPTIYLENPANSNATVGGQIVFGMRSTEEQVRIGATGGTAPALTFGTADIERMRIDSTGIDVTGTVTADELLVSAAGGTLVNLTATDAGTPQNLIKFNDTGGTTAFVGHASSGSDHFYIQNSTEAGDILLNTNGNVGIGTTTPSAKLDVDLGADGAIAEFRGNGSNLIQFKGASNTIVFDTRNSNALTFEMQGNEKARLDTSGNLLVGKTAVDLATQGAEIRSDGVIIGTKAGNILELNRLTSDGDLAHFRKDGAIAGRIGVDYGTEFYMGGGGAGFYLNSASIRPTTGGDAGTLSDNTHDLGSVSTRFKDLHLSGTANIFGHAKMGNGYSYGWDDLTTRITGNSSTDLIGMYTAGSERMKIDSAGNATITANSTSAWATTIQNGTGTNAHGLYVNAPSSSGVPFRVDGAGSEHMRITPAGNVGIGSSTPLSKLHIVQNGSTPPLGIQFSDGSLYKNLGTAMHPATQAVGGNYVHVKLRTVYNDTAMTMFRLTGYASYSAYMEAYVGCYRYGGARNDPYGLLISDQGTGSRVAAAYNTTADPGYLVIVVEWGHYNGFMIEHIGAGGSYGAGMQPDVEIIEVGRSTGIGAIW